MGWLTMCAGYALSFPSARNAVLIAVALPFMMWRIEQEESLLNQDREFVAYGAGCATGWCQVSSNQAKYSTVCH
jgi:hypothetical protein